MNSVMNRLDAEGIRQATSLRDLSDPSQGVHALNIVVNTIANALSDWNPEIRRPDPVVNVSDNYDNLLYPKDAAARSPRYARYVNDQKMLRTQMSSAIPPYLREVAKNLVSCDRTVMLPGLVWRRDCVDRTHVGEPHQMDVWRVTDKKQMDRSDLLAFVGTVLGSIMPGVEWRANETEHPYTDGGIEVEARIGDRWLEVLECGLIGKKTLDFSGLDSNRWSGLAMGMGLDRLVMIRKRMDDIRLLRALDPRISKQMLNLDPYQPINPYPTTKRDLSIAIEIGVTDEEIGDIIRSALGSDAASVEEAVVVTRTSREELVPVAVERLGVEPGQENLLIRMKIRSVDYTIDRITALELCRRAYVALHRGSAPGTPPASPPGYVSPTVSPVQTASEPEEENSTGMRM